MLTVKMIKEAKDYLLKKTKKYPYVIIDGVKYIDINKTWLKGGKE